MKKTGNKKVETQVSVHNHLNYNIFWVIQNNMEVYPFLMEACK